MTIENAALRQFINQSFSDEELDMLCFDYFPEVTNDFGNGMSKNHKVIILIGHCERRGRLPDLHAALERERPEAWKAAFTTAPPVETFRGNVSTPTITRDPRQVFISHATADAEFAHALAADLRAKGWRVWIALDSIRPGEKWMEAINRGLETSEVFVVALTPDAVGSKWVSTETYAALDMSHRDEIRFAALDVAESRLPVLWRQFQYVSFRHSYETGLDELLGWLDGQPVETFRRNVSIAPNVPVEETAQRPSTPNRRIHEKTGIELIRIPAGPFLYGVSGILAWIDGNRQRTIDLPEYWIGRAPVTNAQFARFVRSTGHRTTAEEKGQGYAWTGSKWEWVKGADWRHPGGPKSSIDGKDDHPVVQVSWDDAKAFCDWAGLALPSEEQWEKAARGTDGRIWPWGDEPPTDRHCNFNRNVDDTTPVGRYSPRGDSPYGCADMAGNVWEWTGSWYKEGKWRALRGGSWDYDDRLTRAAYRNGNNPDGRNYNFGFRVVELLSDPDF